MRRVARTVASLSLVIVGLGAQLVMGAPVAAQATDDVDLAQQLAERHAPVIKTVAQDELCDRDGEQFAPMSVEAVLDNPEILLRQVGTGNPVVKVAPGASDLFELRHICP